MTLAPTGQLLSLMFRSLIMEAIMSLVSLNLCSVIPEDWSRANTSSVGYTGHFPTEQKCRKSEVITFSGSKPSPNPYLCPSAASSYGSEASTSCRATTGMLPRRESGEPLMETGRCYARVQHYLNTVFTALKESAIPMETGGH